MLKRNDSKATIEKILAWKKALGESWGNFNQYQTAAQTGLSNHFKYFLLLAVNTNWWYKDGMRLLLRMNNRFWGFREARLMLRSPSFSLPAMSVLVLIGERNPQVLLDTCDVFCGYQVPENPQMGVWVDNAHFPLAINVNSQQSGLTIQPHTNFQATEIELSRGDAEQVLEAA